MTFRDNLLGARLYVFAFVICLVAPGALLTISMPRLAFFGHWPPSPTRFTATLMMWLVLGTSCLVAALGIESRLARWLAAMVLSAGVLWSGYRYLSYLFVAPHWSEGLIFIGLSFPFLCGPLCVGIWLCFPRFHPGPHQPRPARVSPSRVER